MNILEKNLISKIYIMNVNITGINDLSEDVELLKSEFLILSDVVDNIPNTYVNQTAFLNFSNNYDDYKILNNTNLSILNLDIEIFRITM